MPRVEEILASVRDVLADTRGTRWPNPTLLRHLTLGVNDFLLRTRSTKSTMYINLESNVSMYTVKEWSQKILRVQYLNTALILKTTQEMDLLDPNWKNTVGIEPLYVIFDTYPQGTFRIYPKVEDVTLPETSYNSLYGAIIDIENTEDLYRLPSFGSIPLNMYKYLEVTYIKKQGKVTEVSELDLDEIYDEALIYYTSGMALRNDADTQNRAFGAEQLKLYDSLVRLAVSNESQNNNNVARIGTSYKGFQ